MLLPNGWYPPVLWRAAPAWREARHCHIPDGWSLDGIKVSDLVHQNRVPSRFSNPFTTTERVRDALVGRLVREGVSRNRDILLCQFALPYGAAAADAAKELDIPFVVQLRGDDVWIWPHKDHGTLQAFRHSLGSAELVLSVSQALIDGAAKLCNGAMPPAIVVPNGIDVTQFRPASDEKEKLLLRRQIGIEGHQLVILCVANAIVRKGWEELLDALGDLDVPNMVLLGVSPGAHGELDIVTEASRRAPGLSVRLLRGLRGAELANVYRAVDVFCLASHWEGLSNAVLEGMASGLPVVTTSVAGHPEVITSFIDGILVPAKDSKALAEALRSVLGSIELRSRLGRAARRRALGVGDSGRAGARLGYLFDALRRGTISSVFGDESPYGEVAFASVEAAEILSRAH
ncbi:MAG: glycosyltransferase family 4 protein [Anaerolineae bacterium]|nr:glycosyltransferase family 4 protein [Gemmatimonadaceae bacterium]